MIDMKTTGEKPNDNSKFTDEQIKLMWEYYTSSNDLFDKRKHEFPIYESYKERRTNNQNDMSTENTCGPSYYSGEHKEESFANAIIEVAQEAIKARDILARQEYELKKERRLSNSYRDQIDRSQKELAELRQKNFDLAKEIKASSEVTEGLRSDADKLFSIRYWLEKQLRTRTMWSSDQKRVLKRVLELI